MPATKEENGVREPAPPLTPVRDKPPVTDTPPRCWQSRCRTALGWRGAALQECGTCIQSRGWRWQTLREVPDLPTVSQASSRGRTRAAHFMDMALLMLMDSR